MFEKSSIGQMRFLYVLIGNSIIISTTFVQITLLMSNTGIAIHNNAIHLLIMHKLTLCSVVLVLLFITIII